MEQMTKDLKKEQANIATKICNGQSVKDFADYRELVGRFKQISSDIITLHEALQDANGEDR